MVISTSRKKKASPFWFLQLRKNKRNRKRNTRKFTDEPIGQNCRRQEILPPEESIASGSHPLWIVLGMTSRHFLFWHSKNGGEKEDDQDVDCDISGFWILNANKRPVPHFALSVAERRDYRSRTSILHSHPNELPCPTLFEYIGPARTWITTRH